MEKTFYTFVNPKKGQGMFFTGHAYTSSLGDAIFYESEENAKEELDVIIPEEDRKSCSIIPVKFSADIPDVTLESLKGLTSEDEILPILFNISPSFYEMCKEMPPYDFDNMGTEESGEDIYTFFFKDDDKNIDFYVTVNPQQDYVAGYYYNAEKGTTVGDIPDGKIEETTFKRIYENVKS